MSPCRALAIAIAAVLLGADARAQYDFSPVDALIQQLVDSSQELEGAGILVHADEDALHETYLGSWGPATRPPIASASKLLSAIVILSLVDDGLVDLDDPVSLWLPAFTGDHAGITLRQCLSHTSGLPSQHAILQVQSITLEQSVDFIATLPLVAPPGTAFNYGGVSFSVAGRVAEVVTGQTWDALVQTRLNAPLGTTSIAYDGLGVTANPRIGGGAATTLADLGRATRMIQLGGTIDGSAVLSASAVAAMTTDLTDGLPIIGSPAPDATYGLGLWINETDPAGTPRLFSSPGAFGTWPWFDRELGLSGVFLLEGTLSAFRPTIEAAVELVRQIVAAGPALGPCGAGTVGQLAGGPHDVLLLNGAAGGTARRVDVGVGAPITFAMTQPPTTSAPVPFAIFAHIGVPVAGEAFAFPGLVGTSCFAPYPLAPEDPALFTLATAFGPDPTSLIIATPTPWSFTYAPGIPVPYLLTFQGIMQLSPLVVRVTNGVSVNVH